MPAIIPNKEPQLGPSTGDIHGWILLAFHGNAGGCSCAAWGFGCEDTLEHGGIRGFGRFSKDLDLVGQELC